MTLTDWDAIARRGSFSVFQDVLVRVRDMDTQGHVNNSVIAAYLEEGRFRLLNHTIRPSLDPSAIGGFVVAEQIIRYLREIREAGMLQVGTRVERIGNSSFVMGQGLFSGETCLATAQLTMVHIGKVSRRGERVSDAFRTVLEAYMSKG
jgi:acyl-CoA thioester hydrolase